MIYIITVIFGVLTAAVVIVFRKKLTLSWCIALLCGALTITGIGVGFLWSSWLQQRQDTYNVYLALRYLEHNRTEEASYYLRRINVDTFDSIAAEVVLETARDNGTLVRMKLDSLKGTVKTDIQRGTHSMLSSLEGIDHTAILNAAETLRLHLDISDDQRAAADAQFAAETGFIVGDGTETSYEVDPKTALRQAVNAAIASGRYDKAVQQAALLVDESASADNRLLLAESIAECVYSGVFLTGNEFLTDPEQKQTATDERELLLSQIAELSTQIDEVQFLLDHAISDSESEQYSERHNQLLAERQDKQAAYDYLFIYRAFSSIADLHTLDAAIVRARLYFAMRDYATAVETLRHAANSLAGRFTSDTALRNALRILNEAYSAGQSIGTQTTEFKNAMQTLLSPGAVDMVSVSSSTLTQDFVNYIISEQKTYGHDLYVTNLDLTNFPEVAITLAGRDTAKERILALKDVLVRDTHTNVDFIAETIELDGLISNICCVVDESGSMGGEPIAHLKSALSSFIDSLEDNTNMALIGFSNSAYIRAEMGMDRAALQAAVSEISASGGTNITSGIISALEVCENTSGRNTILLMTDGQSDVNMSIVEQAAAQGIVIHTIGFGGAIDEILQSIADATGGQYIRADSSSELTGVYRSLVGMIGNEVVVRYRAIESLEDSNSRYFFLRIEDQNVSLRLDYTLPAADQIELNTLAPMYIDEAEQARLRERNGVHTITLQGKNLADVTTATIGGRAASIIEQRDDRITVEVPPTLPSGWQSIELSDPEHGTVTFDGMLCVGNTLGLRRFRLGELSIESYNSILLGDGTLVLTGSVGIRDRNGNQDRTLDMYVNGLVSLPVNSAALLAHRNGTNNNDAFILGSTGSLQCVGTCYLDWNDSGYYSGILNEVANGRFLIEYDGTQAKLIQQ